MAASIQWIDSTDEGPVCRMLTHRFLLSGLINWLTRLFFITHMLLVFDVDVSQWTECVMSCGNVA